MKNYSAANIRNIALIGHGGSGKTTLAEAILYRTKVIGRMGKTPDGNTVLDFDAEEIRRGFPLIRPSQRANGGLQAESDRHIR